MIGAQGPRPTGAIVVVCDDRRLLAESLTCYLASRELVKTATAVLDGDAAVRAVRGGADVLVLSVGHTGTTDVPDVLEALRNLDTGTEVVALAPPHDIEALTSALTLGAIAICRDDVPPAGVYEAVLHALAHQPVIPDHLVDDVMQRLAVRTPPPADDSAALTAFTAREVEVLQLLTAGLSRSDIAARLDMSPNTARTHVGNVMRKLHVHSQHAAAVKGAQLIGMQTQAVLRRD